MPQPVSDHAEHVQGVGDTGEDDPLRDGELHLHGADILFHMVSWCEPPRLKSYEVLVVHQGQDPEVLLRVPVRGRGV